jgi:proteasome lid subunit RPN8/RPN11
MDNLQVFISKGQLDYFRRKARDASVEIGAVLVGEYLTPFRIQINKIVYPEIYKATVGSLYINEDSIKAIHLAAQCAGQKVLGTIHSHVDAPPIMSTCDFESHRSFGDVVSAIVGVTAKRRTIVCFWQVNCSLPCFWEYTENLESFLKAEEEDFVLVLERE